MSEELDVSFPNPLESIHGIIIMKIKIIIGKINIVSKLSQIFLSAGKINDQ